MVDRQVTGRGDMAGGVVQITRCSTEIEGNGAAQQTTALVVDAGAVNGQIVGGVDQAQVLVGQLAVNGQAHISTAGQGAAAVVEATGVRVNRSRRDHALDIAQRLFDTQGQGLVAQQLAVVVAQAFSRQGKGLGAGDFTALVVHALEVVQHQQRRVDQAALVIQLTVVEVQGQRRIAFQRTALLVQAGDAGGQVLGADTAAILVGQLGGGQVQVVSTAEETAVAVVEVAGIDRNRTLAADRTLIAVVEAGAVQVDAAVGHQSAALVDQCTVAGQAQLTGTGETAARVIQAGSVSRQGTFAADQAGELVGQGTVEGDHQARLGTHFTAAVIQAAAGQRGAALADQLAQALVDHLRDLQAQRGVGKHFAAFTVVQRLAVEIDRLHAGDLPGAVIDSADIQGQQFFCRDQRRVAVVQGAAGQGQVAVGDQRAILLVEGGDIGGQVALAGDSPRGVVHGVGGQVQRAIGDDRAAGVIKMRGGQIKALLGSDTTLLGIVERLALEGEDIVRTQAAILVIHCARGGDIQNVIGHDQAGEVVHGAQGQGAVALAGDFACIVVQITEAGDQGILAFDQAALGIEHSVCGQIQGVGTDDPALVLVIQRGSHNRGFPLTTQGATLVAQDLRGSDIQITAGDNALAVVDDVLRSKVDVRHTVTGFIRINPGFDDAVVGQLTAAIQRDAILGHQVVLAGQITLGFNVQSRTGINRPLGFKAGGFDINGPTRPRLDHAQMTVGIELDIPPAGDHLAIEFYPDTGLSTDQPNSPGIHAAQRRGVDRQLRRIRRIGPTRRRLERLGIDIVGTGNNCQLLRIDLGIELGRAGNDFELIDIAGVQPRAFDGYTAAIHLIPGELTVANHWLARGQRRLRRIDKAATVTTDPIRVGHDHMGRLPRHFGIPAQLARARTVHLVENDIGRRAIEVLVAENDPAQLRRLGPSGGVVEDDPIGPDVVIGELVMGQPLGIGRGDIDDGHAIARLPERRTRCTDHNPVRLNQQRLPEHRVRQNECQAPLG